MKTAQRNIENGDRGDQAEKNEARREWEKCGLLGSAEAAANADTECALLSKPAKRFTRTAPALSYQGEFSGISELGAAAR